MEQFRLTTAVIFIIFNRPGTTSKVFDRIREARPPKFLVIADGARKNKTGELEQCQQCRQIIKKIDWDCELYMNFSDVNLGCRERVSSGITWALNIVDEAIIVEDDCLPHNIFFRFCQEMLEKHRENHRVMMISGNNFYKGNEDKRDLYYRHSYSFSKRHPIWGWATWRRAWQHYDDRMEQWPQVKNSEIIYAAFSNSKYGYVWTDEMQECYMRRVDAWDGAWLLAMIAHDGLCVIPKTNLVTNIGCGINGTTINNLNHAGANLIMEPICFPLSHPESIVVNKRADYDTDKVFAGTDRKTLVGAYLDKRCFRRNMNLVRSLFAPFIRNKKCVIWGTNTAAQRFYQCLRSSGYEIAFFVDNAIEKQNKKVNGLPVYNPKIILEHKDELFIFIGSIDSFKPIEQQLLDMGFVKGIHFYPQTATSIGEFYSERRCKNGMPE